MTSERQPLQHLPAAQPAMQTMTSTSSTSGQPPVAWIERIFARLSAMYGRHFADMWAGVDPVELKATWQDGLAGYNGQEIARGLEACKARKFPPTMPEFLTMCRPVADYETAYNEAVREMVKRRSPVREGDRMVTRDRWTDPAVYWAAVAMGRDLHTRAYHEIKARWQAELDKARLEKRGPVPEYAEALPAPGGVSVPSEVARARIAEIAAKLRINKNDEETRADETATAGPMAADDDSGFPAAGPAGLGK